MNYIQRITSALDKDAETVSILSHLPVAKLDAKLMLLKKQIATARKFEQYDAVELLHIWEDQINNAKELKQHIEIEESTLLDVDMQLPELAAFEMIEKRQELLKSKLLTKDFFVNREN